jgi:hypothetical protein
MHPSARVSLAFAFVLLLVSATSQLLVAEVSALDEDVSWIDLQAVPDDAVKVDPLDRFVVYREEGATRGLAELWSAPVAGGNPMHLSGGLAPADEVDAFAVSPDGRWVVFTTTNAGGGRRLYRVPIAGGLPIRVDGDRVPIADDGWFAIRADSQAVAFFGGAEGSAQVVALANAIFASGFEPGHTGEWSSDTVLSSCPTPTGGPTLHSSVTTNQVWTANASPHVVTTNILVPAGVTLRLDPCAEVRIRPGFDITVQGTLIAIGTPSQRIAFRRDNPALAWDSIWAKSPGVAWLSFVDISGGGAAGASVIGEGVDTLPPAAPLVLGHVTVTGSAGYGIRLFRRAGFHDLSNNLVVSGSGAADPSEPFPVRMSLNTVGTLPTGIYTGNASDLIQVVGEGNPTVEVDDAFHNRGVPYQIGGAGGAFGLIVVSGTSSVATLSIDPGVEMRFYSAGSNYGGLFVGTSGATSPSGRLVASGTAAAPIVFTGAGGAPVAGSWEGITFFGALAGGNVLDHVRIDAAGRNGGDAGFGCPPASFAETSGALKIFSQPSASFLTNSTISRSSTHGVFRAWTGAQVDFMAGNTFDQVAFCKQVLPKPTPPATCPAMPPCP